MAKPSKRPAALEHWHSLQENYDRLNDYLPPSLQRQLEDRSTLPGTTKPGDFFTFTPEALGALSANPNARQKRRKQL